MAQITEGLLRTHHCAQLKASDQDQIVTLCGWVNKKRDLGGLHFIDIRDKYGLTQLSFDHYLDKGGKEELLKNATGEEFEELQRQKFMNLKFYPSVIKIAFPFYLMPWALRPMRT